MTTETYRLEDAPPVAVPTLSPRSRTWAIRHLAKFFVAPYMRNATTDEDRSKGVQRWRVFCRNRETRAEIGITEVCGQAATIGKAAVMAACARIGVTVTFDGAGAVSFVAKPLEVPAATVPPAPEINP